MTKLLKELMQLDYELYCRIGKSHLSEDQWEWLIEQFKIYEIKEGKNEV